MNHCLHADSSTMTSYYIFTYETAAPELPEERYLSQAFVAAGLTPSVLVSRLIPYTEELEPQQIWELLSQQEGFVRKGSFDLMETDNPVDIRKIITFESD